MNSFNVADFNAGLVLLRPEIFLGTAACVILLLDLFISQARRSITSTLSILTVLISAALVMMQPWSTHTLALGDMFVLDPLAQVLKVVTLLIVAVAFVYSGEYLQHRSIFKGEYYVLGLFATLGILVLASAAGT